MLLIQLDKETVVNTKKIVGMKEIKYGDKINEVYTKIFFQGDSSINVCLPLLEVLKKIKRKK